MMRNKTGDIDKGQIIGVCMSGCLPSCFYLFLSSNHAKLASISTTLLTVLRQRPLMLLNTLIAFLYIPRLILPHGVFCWLHTLLIPLVLLVFLFLFSLPIFLHPVLSPVHGLSIGEHICFHHYQSLSRCCYLLNLYFQSRLLL